MLYKKDVDISKKLVDSIKIGRSKKKLLRSGVLLPCYYKIVFFKKLR